MAINLRTLNPQQRQATMHLGGPLLILAGAGSGKTRVITHRVGYMIEQGIAPGNILAVSFTNKAAEEMAERVAHLIGNEVASKVQMSTFHSLGHDILRRDIHHLGYRTPFTILDDTDQKNVIKDILAELNMDPQVANARRIQALISRAKMAMAEPAELPELRYDSDMPFAQRVYRHYKKRMIGLNAVDFDDLIGMPVQLFLEFEEVRRKYARRFQYVMIDEFQDTNHTQMSFLHEIVKDHHNICVVGDDDQSIYGFRGAVAENILTFESRYAGCQVVKLEQNYRSTGHILEAANTVIARNLARKDKRLWSAQGDGEKLRLVPCDDAEAEAAYVASEIERLRATTEYDYGDMAILYRANALTGAFEKVFKAQSVPYTIVGDQDLYDSKEIKDAVAYLKACFNPADETSLRRIVNTPPRGIGSVTMATLSDRALANGWSFFEALQDAAKDQRELGLGLSSTHKLTAFVRMIEAFHERFELLNLRGGDMAEAAAELMDRAGYKEYVRSSESNPNVARRRLENLDRLISDIRHTQERGTNLEGYLTRLTLNRARLGEDASPVQSVRMMTLHASKGLEFPVVFMVGVEEGLLPHARSMSSLKDIAEERRLMYVGITRARERLTITLARERAQGSGKRACEPSRFIAEIPEHLLIRDVARYERVMQERQESIHSSAFDQLRALGLLGKK